MSCDCDMALAGDGPVSHDAGDVGGEDHQLVCTAPRNAQVHGAPPPLFRGRKGCVNMYVGPSPSLQGKKERRARVP